MDVVTLDSQMETISNTAWNDLKNKISSVQSGFSK